jgi:hypothetical protein
MQIKLMILLKRTEALNTLLKKSEVILIDPIYLILNQLFTKPIIIVLFLFTSAHILLFIIIFLFCIINIVSTI